MAMLSKGTWCSGITPAQHAGGPGFKPQCVHCRLMSRMYLDATLGGEDVCAQRSVEAGHWRRVACMKHRMGAAPGIEPEISSSMLDMSHMHHCAVCRCASVGAKLQLEDSGVLCLHE